MFSFTAQAGHIYNLRCVGSNFNCRGRLVDSAGTILVTSAAGYDANITRELSTAGTYYFRVYADNGTSISTYSITLTDHGLDDHGDTTSAATAIVASGSSFNGKLETSGDTDVFSFAAQAGHIYNLRCVGSNFNCRGQLLDGAGNVLVTSSAGYDANLSRKLAAGGTYYFRVYADNGASISTYSITLTDLGADDHGDSAAAATAMPGPDVFVSGKLEYSGDVDYFSVSLVNKAYQLTGTGVGLSVTVYGPNGTTVIKTGTAPFTFTTGAVGTYYLGVRASSADKKFKRP